MGTRNAAVFPEPVLAMATTSLPSITSGIHCVWKVKRAYRELWPKSTRLQSGAEDIGSYFKFLLFSISNMHPTN